jgi:isopenicillin N synthase-like dioxygenase
LVDAVREACRMHDFFRAVNHSIPAGLMTHALELLAAFFALPDEEKVVGYARPDSGQSKYKFVD